MSTEQFMNPRERRRQRRVEMTEQIAYRLYEKRSKRGYGGSSDQDWLTAEKIARNPIARRSFWLNQWLKGRWRGSISWYESTTVEHGLETLTEDLKNLAIFDLMSLLANLAIIISLASFLTGGERQRHDQQVYEAWQIITAAHGQPGSGGRLRALEFLNSTPRTLGRRRWFGVPWPREDLTGLDVSKANLSGIKLPRAELLEANFQQAVLRSANFRLAVLGGANFQQADLGDAHFQKASLEGANFQQADLWDAHFQQAVLGGANFQQAVLGGTNFQQAVLGGANFQQAVLGGANFQQAVPRGANFQQAYLGRANFQQADLGGANFQGADLREADFQGASLGSVNLENALLFENALLLATDLRASKNLTIQQLEEAKLCNVALPSSVQGVDPDRDCETMPQTLLEFWVKYNEQIGIVGVATLEEAQRRVDQARQQEWDDSDVK